MKFASGVYVISPFASIVTVPCSALNVEESIVPSTSFAFAITCATSSTAVVSPTVITGASFWFSFTTTLKDWLVTPPFPSSTVNVTTSPPTKPSFGEYDISPFSSITTVPFIAVTDDDNSACVLSISLAVNDITLSPSWSTVCVTILSIVGASFTGLTVIFITFVITPPFPSLTTKVTLAGPL